MRVGSQVTASSERLQELSQDCAMPGTRVDDADRRSLQPEFDQIERGADGKRVAEKTGPGCEAKERK